ncbi:uncharacterized protein LOC134842853 isoform X3 [Symsagittifera roscoffensis]|uniref:uncharacterized protein LOC134842853 isoform X3 n=1 Tax=Symsagittifera roscoffensis TaxID=84072 RepID=UPI00307C31EC
MSSMANNSENSSLVGREGSSSGYYFHFSESPWFQFVCAVLLTSAFVPQSRRLNRGLCYGLQVLAYLVAAVWVYMTHFGLHVFFVFFVMTSLSFVQTLYVLYHHMQTNLSPSFDKLYMELFRPLRMPLKEYKKLVQDPDVRLRTMAPGETYAIEGVSVPDQLSLLVSGCVHVSVEGKFIHKIDEFSFLDSPEWESYSEEFPEHFQVTLTAIRHSTYISWPRKVLEAILCDNPYLNSTMTNLIGRDITNKLYLLNQQATRSSSVQSQKHSAKELRTIWSDESKRNYSGSVGGLKKPETGSLTALREMRSTERQNTFGDSIYGSMGDSFDEIKRNNSSAMGQQNPTLSPYPSGGGGGGCYISSPSSSAVPIAAPSAQYFTQHSTPFFSSSSPYSTAVLSRGTPTHFSNTDSYTLSSSNLTYPPNHYPQSPFSPPPGIANRSGLGRSPHAVSSYHSGIGTGGTLSGMELKDVLNSTTCMLQTALSNLNEAIGHEHSTASLPRKVASIDGTMTGRDLFRSRTVTPQTHSTESDPTNPSSQSQNSLPVIRMHTGEEDGGILSIRVPLTDKTVGSYDSPATGSSRRVRVTGSHPDIIGRIPRYGDMDQSTSSSTEPSLSLEDDSVIHSVARRKVRPLIRSKQIITEEEHQTSCPISSSFVVPIVTTTECASQPSPANSALPNQYSKSPPLPTKTTESTINGLYSQPCETSALIVQSECTEIAVQVHDEPARGPRLRPITLPAVIVEPEIVINPGTPTPDDQDSDLEYKWWSSLQQDSIDDPHYFVSLADMTGAPHSNHTTIEEEESASHDILSSRRGSNNLTEGIDLESMESDMLDPATDIDEILKKAASSLTSSRNSQTSEESPRRCSEEETSLGGVGGVKSRHQSISSGPSGVQRKNSIGIQVPHRRSHRGSGIPPQLSVDSGGSSVCVSEEGPRRLGRRRGDYWKWEWEWEWEWQWGGGLQNGQNVESVQLGADTRLFSLGFDCDFNGVGLEQWPRF